MIGKTFQFLYKLHSFGTVPYLIKIGDGVRITSGCTFLTHDSSSIVAYKIDNKPYDKFGKIEIGNNDF